MQSNPIVKEPSSQPSSRVPGEFSDRAWSEPGIAVQVQELINAMEQIAPTRFAEAWDNVGLLVGDPQQSINGAMLTIDYMPEVACEAAGAKCDAIVAYHPPIF